MSFFHKSGIVNVKMVITEEKILSNIDKVQKLINPNSKKQIVQLEDDSYFKDLVESIKTYLLEYPKKKNFPRSVYKASYDLVEYATNQFEENTRKIERLIRKREKNIKLGSVLRDATAAVRAHAKNWKEIVAKLSTKYPADVAESLNIIGNSIDTTTEEYQDACKLIEAKVKNLEQNLHIEIDMERIEDRSKALSYIGIEIAEALKYIPAPAEEYIPAETINNIDTAPVEEFDLLETEPVVSAVEAEPVTVTKVAESNVAAAVQVGDVVTPIVEQAVVAPEPTIATPAEEIIIPQNVNSDVTVQEIAAEPVTVSAVEATPVEEPIKVIDVDAEIPASVVEASNVELNTDSTSKIFGIESTPIDINEESTLMDVMINDTQSVAPVSTISQIQTQATTPDINSGIASESIGTDTNVASAEQNSFLEETRFETKPSLWQRIKNSKIVRTVKYIMSIRVKLDYPALPEGKGNY